MQHSVETLGEKGPCIEAQRWMGSMKGCVKRLRFGLVSDNKTNATLC